MSQLSGRKILTRKWIDAVSPTLDGFLNCSILLLDMAPEDPDLDYDWRTNTGGSPEPTVLYNGEAQAQVYRFTLTVDSPVGSVDQYRTVRFTIDEDLFGDVNVRKGMQVIVMSCELNPSLTRYQYIVNSGLNSGAPLRRTIECEVDMARVIGEVPLPIPYPGPAVFPGGG